MKNWIKKYWLAIIGLAFISCGSLGLICCSSYWLLTKKDNSTVNEKLKHSNDSLILANKNLSLANEQFVRAANDRNQYWINKSNVQDSINDRLTSELKSLRKYKPKTFHKVDSSLIHFRDSVNNLYRK